MRSFRPFTNSRPQPQHGRIQQMEPNAFVAEVYRRMSLRHASELRRQPWSEMAADPKVEEALHEVQHLLPSNRDSAILDIGFGNGWFIAACLKLGYRNVSGAEFAVDSRSYVADWSPAVSLLNIDTNIGDFLLDRQQAYDFIHLSHVIEHIPKYSLLYIVDALYAALRPGGMLILRTPNMEGPCAMSCLFVTLGHEYGFCGSNLVSLLSICNFDQIQFHAFRPYRPSPKQRIGMAIRAPFLLWSKIKHRLFGVNEGNQWGIELVVTARRGTLPSLLDPKYK